MAKVDKKYKASFNISPENQRKISHLLTALCLSILMAVMLWQFVVKVGNKLRFDAEVERLTQEQQQVLVNFQSDMMRRLADIAQRERLDELAKQLPLLSDSDRQKKWFDIQQRLMTALPDGQSAHFYTLHEAQKEKENGGQIGFVELDMINRAESNEAAYPEVSKIKNSAAWEIHWVLAVYESSAASSDQRNDAPENVKYPLGILHVTTSMDGLSQAAANYDLRLAQTQLLQTIGRQRVLTFLSVGQGGGYGQRSKFIPDSHWQIVVSPSKILLSKAASIPWWVIVLQIIATMVFLGLAWQLAQRKNQRLAALYKAMDVKIPSAVEKNVTADDQVELSNPIYLSDQQLAIEDEDVALIAGSHQEKIHDSDADNQQPIQSVRAASSQKAMAVPAHIFRAYDIRGLIDDELTPAIAEAIGAAVATEALEQGERALLVGYDARTHSPVLCAALEQGILSTGCDVIRIGLVPTPLLNFAAVFSEQSSSGIIVTASHNPKNYNGFKIIINERTLVDDDIQGLYQRITNGVMAQGQKGDIYHEDFSQDYIDTILADIAINSGVRIVIDAGNGAASELGPRLFTDLGCDVEPLFCEFDGEFPNHAPDPSQNENLQALVEKVLECKADLGIALDGDGDRLVVVSGDGKIVWPDQLLMLFARDVVSRNPGCDVIFDIKSTRQLNQVISSYGGRPIIWKTGHSHIKAKMKETDALLAGEFSGHIFFKERWFGFDDGLYAAARLLEIMSLRDQSIGDMLSAMPPMYATQEIKISVSEENKFSLVDRLIEIGDFSSGEKTTIDGLRVDFAKGWGLVRASNTAPALTLRFEASNENGVEQLKTLFKRELYRVDKTLNLDF
jgi:phosphomannomutase/phosphoglucomutase